MTSRIPRPAYRPVPPELCNTGEMGTLYLIHFEQRLAHAGHYLGWTTDLDRRLAVHGKGSGGRLMATVVARGIGWSVSRTWEGDRNLERRIKNNGSLARFCPSCTDRPRWYARAA